MSGPSTRRLNQLISEPGAALAALVADAHAAAALDGRLRPLLDPALAGHCRVAALRDGRLVLSADSPGWATRLRYHTEHIRENLVAGGYRVSTVRVVVAPPTPAPPSRPAPEPLSASSATAVDSAARCVTHPPLAAALRRLAQNRG